MTGGNKMKEREFETAWGMTDEAEHTDFVIVEGQIYPEDVIPIEVIEGLPEVIDEDWLYEAYRDEGVELEKRRRDQ
jgi:hypothetical protein